MSEIIDGFCTLAGGVLAMVIVAVIVMLMLAIVIYSIRAIVGLYQFIKWLLRFQ